MQLRQIFAGHGHQGSGGFVHLGLRRQVGHVGVLPAQVIGHQIVQNVNDAQGQENGAHQPRNSGFAGHAEHMDAEGIIHGDAGGAGDTGGQIQPDGVDADVIFVDSIVPQEPAHQHQGQTGRQLGVQGIEVPLGKFQQPPEHRTQPESGNDDGKGGGPGDDAGIPVVFRENGRIEQNAEQIGQPGADTGQNEETMAQGIQHQVREQEHTKQKQNFPQRPPELGPVLFGIIQQTVSEERSAKKLDPVGGVSEEPQEIEHGAKLLSLHFLHYSIKHPKRKDPPGPAWEKK